MASSVVAALRSALYDALLHWMGEVGPKPFAGGDHPHLGDIAVFGAIKAIEGLETHTDILQNTAVGDWYRRMEAIVGASARTE